MLSEDKRAELLVDHYKDSFQLTVEHWKTRNRLFYSHASYFNANVVSIDQSECSGAFGE